MVGVATIRIMTTDISNLRHILTHCHTIAVVGLSADRHKASYGGHFAPMAIACSAIGSTSCVRRNTFTMSTGWGIRARLA